MSKDFFIDKVRKLLSHEENYAVMDYFLLGRKSEAVFLAPRSGLKEAFVLPQPAQLKDPILCNNENARKLKFQDPMWVTRVELVMTSSNHFRHFNRTGESLQWHVSSAGMKSEKGSKFEFQGSDEAGIYEDKSILDVKFEKPCNELVLESLPSSAKLHMIRVFGVRAKPSIEVAKQVVQRLSEDLFFTSQRQGDSNGA